MFAPGNASKPFVWQSKARKHVKINRNYIDCGHVASCSPLAVGTSDFLTCCALTAPQTTPAQRQSSGNGHPNSQCATVRVIENALALHLTCFGYGWTEIWLHHATAMTTSVESKVQRVKTRMMQIFRKRRWEGPPQSLVQDMFTH